MVRQIQIFAGGLNLWLCTVTLLPFSILDYVFGGYAVCLLPWQYIKFTLSLFKFYKFPRIRLVLSSSIPLSILSQLAIVQTMHYRLRILC